MQTQPCNFPKHISVLRSMIQTIASTTSKQRVETTETARKQFNLSYSLV